MKTDPVPHVHMTPRTFSERVNAYLDYVMQCPVWQLPIHVIPLIILFVVSVTLNQFKFNKEK